MSFLFLKNVLEFSPKTVNAFTSDSFWCYVYYDPPIFHYEKFQTYSKVGFTVYTYAHHLDSTIYILCTCFITSVYTFIHHQSSFYS